MKTTFDERTTFGDLHQTAATVYRLTTESSAYLLGVYSTGTRLSVVVRGEPGSGEEHVIVWDSDPRIDERSLWDVTPLEWMGHVLQAGTMITSRIRSVAEATDEKTIRLFTTFGLTDASEDHDEVTVFTSLRQPQQVPRPRSYGARMERRDFKPGPVMTIEDAETWLSGDPPGRPERLARFVVVQIATGRSRSKEAVLIAASKVADGVLECSNTEWKAWLAAVRATSGFSLSELCGTSAQPRADVDLLTWLQQDSGDVTNLPMSALLACLRHDDPWCKSGLGMHLLALLQAPPNMAEPETTDAQLCSFLRECYEQCRGWFNCDDGSPGPFQAEIDERCAWLLAGMEPPRADTKKAGAAIVLTACAKADIRTIVEFSRSCGSETVVHFCEELRKACNRLSDEACSRCFDLQTPMLVQVAGYWLVCGAATDAVVRVARVIHQLSNWESDLFGGMSFPAMADDDY